MLRWIRQWAAVLVAAVTPASVVRRRREAQAQRRDQVRQAARQRL